MEKAIQKQQTRARRHARVRARVSGTAEKPRLAVFRSNKFMYAQLINDETHTTIASADSRKVKGEGKLGTAKAVGAAIAEAAKKQNIEVAVFDRGGFKYMGAVAAVADGAREAGLKV